jgi:hypothetical protein
MKKLISLGLSMSLCLLLAGVLNAATACMQGDTNNDGSLSCSEAKSLASGRFTAMDTNRDNRLSMDEMETGMTGIHKSMETIGDGKVKVQSYVNYWCGAAPKTG